MHKNKKLHLFFATGQSRKIPSVSYVEGVEIPKRTQRFVWRAAVEMSMNISQLAMQVWFITIK